MYERIAGKRTPDAVWEWISPAVYITLPNYYNSLAMIESYALDSVIDFGTRMIIVRAPCVESFDLVDWDEIERANRPTEGE